MAVEVFIPKLGQTVEQVTLVKWLVPDGAKVTRGQEIIEVETDKAVFPVEAEGKGWLHIGPYKDGDVIPVLTVVGLIGKEDEKFVMDSLHQPDTAPDIPVGITFDEPGLQTSSPSEVEKGQNKVYASPRARRLANEKGIDISQVQPTGGEGTRVVERDVISYLTRLSKATPVAQRMAAVEGVDLQSINGTGPGGKITKADVSRMMQVSATNEAVPFVDAAEVIERIPLKGVRALIAERMSQSVHTSARVTLVIEADATELVNIRERIKTKIGDSWGFSPGYSDILAIFVSKALRKFPYMNARLTTDAIELMGHVNIGMAVDTNRGLLVPVVRDVDHLQLRQFGQIFRRLVDDARDGRSLPDDLSGGTFTITNLGLYDIGAFTPVINLPECAILGAGRIAAKPAAHQNKVVIRQMWTLSLVFDHRLVDGAPAARFLQYIKELIEEPFLYMVE